MTEQKKYDASRGLNNPPVNELEQMAGCRYRLVSAVSKRARKLMDENKRGESRDSSAKDGGIVISDNDALDRAINEFYEGKYDIINQEVSEED